MPVCTGLCQRNLPSVAFYKNFKICKDCTRATYQRYMGQEGTRKTRHRCPRCHISVVNLMQHYRRHHPQDINEAKAPESNTALPLNDLLLEERSPALVRQTWAGCQGVIYFIQAGASGRPIKIGYSANFHRRIQDLQLAVPDSLEVLGLLEGTVGDEADLHKTFSHLRIHGEWYRADQELLEFVKELVVPLEQNRMSQPKKLFLKSYPSYEMAQKEAGRLGISTSRDWDSFHKEGKLPGFPRRPSRYYSEWEGWPSFLQKTSHARLGGSSKS